MTLSGRMCLVTDTTYSLISAKIRQQRVWKWSANNPTMNDEETNALFAIVNYYKQWIIIWWMGHCAARTAGFSKIEAAGGRWGGWGWWLYVDDDDEFSGKFVTETSQSSLV